MLQDLYKVLSAPKIWDVPLILTALHRDYSTPDDHPY